MNKSIKIKGLTLVTTMIFIAAFTRLIDHWPNFTAVGAMALFGSAYFSKKHLAFLVPVLAMWISDLALNNLVYTSESFVWFQSYQLYTIVPMTLIVALGIFLFKKVNTKNVLIGSVLATIIFFLVSNFGTWVSPYSLFPGTFAGLLETYTVAIPFALNSLGGNLFFSAALFGSYALISKKISSLKIA